MEEGAPSPTDSCSLLVGAGPLLPKSQVCRAHGPLEGAFWGDHGRDSCQILEWELGPETSPSWPFLEGLGVDACVWAI